MANYSKNKKYHFTYKTTNLVKGTYYLGMHSTNNIKDGYLGSGKRLYYELNKYGRENFKFEILKYFNSREDLVEAEKNLVNKQVLGNEKCLNLKPGGTGGFTHQQTVNGGKISGLLQKKRIQENPEYRDKVLEHLISMREENRKNGKLRTVNEVYSWKGKKHKPETIEKMKQAHKGTGKGSKNSQYGTCWITNEKENRKIKKTDPIPNGWRLGRKIKEKARSTRERR